MFKKYYIYFLNIIFSYLLTLVLLKEIIFYVKFIIYLFYILIIILFYIYLYKKNFKFLSNLKLVNINTLKYNII